MIYCYLFCPLSLSEAYPLYNFFPMTQHVVSFYVYVYMNEIC